MVFDQSESVHGGYKLQTQLKHTKCIGKGSSLDYSCIVSPSKRQLNMQVLIFYFFFNVSVFYFF